jgi:hypothetical protein
MTSGGAGSTDHGGDEARMYPLTPYEKFTSFFLFTKLDSSSFSSRELELLTFLSF